MWLYERNMENGRTSFCNKNSFFQEPRNKIKGLRVLFDNPSILDEKARSKCLFPMAHHEGPIQENEIVAFWPHTLSG